MAPRLRQACEREAETDQEQQLRLVEPEDTSRIRRASRHAKVPGMQTMLVDRFHPDPQQKTADDVATPPAMVVPVRMLEPAREPGAGASSPINDMRRVPTQHRLAG